MDKKPLISILSSVYNERSYIAQAIRSVLNQTYDNWEWIILDDGSTDGTKDILSGIDDVRVKCLFQANSGNLANNMNKALNMSCGDIIATLDGDDYWPANKLEIQVSSFDDRDAVLSYGGSFLISSKGNTIGFIKIPKDSGIATNFPIGSALKRLLVDADCFICNTTVMYRKSSLLDIGGFVESKGLFQDFATWVNLSLAGRFAPIPDCLGYYRKHFESASFKTDQEAYFENLVNFLREFYNNNSERLRDIDPCFDLGAIEDHWNNMKTKNRIIDGLMRLSLFTKVDLVNPLICAINDRPHLKRLLQKLLGI
jgi:glycosyltransferase involved in cell wall biosynthesis